MTPRPRVIVRPGWLFEPRVARLPDAHLAARRGAATRSAVGRVPAQGPIAARGRDHGVEYLIRQARITDIDRLAAIGRTTMPAMGGGSLDAADLLRQLVYLPNASLLVAESHREIVGGALLVLRPSVAAGGYVGTIDFLVVAPDHDADRVTDALLEDVLRSASNKGCSAVEAGASADPAGLARLERAGFAPAGPVLRRQLAAVGSIRRL
jgi:GNAT superfamily N-acetyltransferase